MNKLWTPEEDDLLLKNHRTMTMKELSIILKRTPDSIRNRLTRLSAKSDKTGVVVRAKKSNKETKTHLIIPDTHVKPGIDNDRLVYLAYYIARMFQNGESIDEIICLGDFADMESLSSYDQGKASFEGRRYSLDVESVVQAQEVFFGKLMELLTPEQFESIKFVMLMGNHENRINRAADENAALHSHLSTEDLKYAEYWDEVHGFNQRYESEGIMYSHYFESGILGKAISGESPARSLLQKLHVSCTAGHSHVRDFCERTTARGEKILGLIAGCFMEHDEEYAKNSNQLWWRGVIVKRSVSNGYYDPQFVSIDEMKRNYLRSVAE